MIPPPVTPTVIPGPQRQIVYICILTRRERVGKHRFLCHCQTGHKSGTIVSSRPGPRVPHTGRSRTTLPNDKPLVTLTPAGSGTKGTYSVISLGCPKNLVDSERMLGLLRLEGYQFVPQPEGVDVVIVNTCGFLRAARDESLETIREMVRLKEKGRVRGVIVAGCLAERDREALLERCPGIDCLLGVLARDTIAEAVNQLVDGQPGPRTRLHAAVGSRCDRDRLRVTPRHLAYLKISEGCDQLCTFCLIPSIRGKHISKPIEEVVAEAEQLAADGVRELILIAQDTTGYGLDLYGRPALDELIGRLEEIRSIEWIRLMYLYPKHITDALVERIAASEKVLPYLDLPLQHINDRLLRRMNRRISRAETERLIERLRARIDRLVLRTAMIVGFPGETQQEFEELVEFVRAVRFERLGVFAYSREPGTAADRLSGHLSREVRRHRRERLLAVQQPIAFAWTEAQVGRHMEVLIDRPVCGEPDAFVGRSYADAPEIDGVVYVTGRGLQAGQFVPCEIVAAQGYDLIGVAVGDPR